MPSTYTTNNGIELIATGEKSGTWGTTTNTNLELLDTSLDGQVTITLTSAGTSGSPNTLPISNGSASNGRNRLVIFNDGSDLGGTVYVQLTPNDAEKIIYVRNSLSGSRSILLFQGTYNASNDYEVPAGTTAVVFFDGAGSGAVAANVFNNAFFDSLRLGSVSVDKILDQDDMSGDDASALATQQSIKAYVDSQVGGSDTLTEVLANGNTTSGRNIQMTTTDELQFRDTALKISSSADGKLDIDADTEIEIVAPTLDIDASTTVTVNTATMAVTGAVDVTGDLDVDNININGNTISSKNTNGDVNISPNGSGTVVINTDLDVDNINVNGNTISSTNTNGNIALAPNGTGVVALSSTDITFGDNDKAIFGTGSDLEIYHDGSESHIKDVGTGILNIHGNAVDIRSSNGLERSARFVENGAAVLYYDNSKKFETVSTGINVTGTVIDDGATHDGDVTFTGASYNAVWDKSDNALEFADNAKAVFGAGSDLQIFHDGSHSRIKDQGTGNLVVQADNMTIVNAANTETKAVFTTDGAVTLYYDNSAKIATTSSGINVTGTVTDDGATHDGDVTFTGASYNAVWDKSDNALEFADNAKATFGTAGDLQIFHDGTDTTIDNNTGTLIVRSSAAGTIEFRDQGTQVLAQFNDNADVKLYYANGEKLATTSSGINVTGTVTDDGATHDGDVTFTGANYNVVWDKSDDQFEFATNAKIKFGLFSEIYDNGAATLMVDVTPIMKLNYNTGGTGGPSFAINHDTTSAADGDTSGNIYFSLNDVQTAFITSTQPDITSSTSSGDLTFKVRQDNSMVTYMTIDGEGEQIDVAKNMVSTADITAVNFNTTSDASLKTNISTFANPLDTINSLRGVAFDWINSGKSEIGVIAQEVEKVLPDLVSTNKEGIKSVKYGNLIAVLIEAVKDQQSQINELKSKLS
jgi:hypothetical protein